MNSIVILLSVVALAVAWTVSTALTVLWYVKLRRRVLSLEAKTAEAERESRELRQLIQSGIGEMREELKSALEAFKLAAGSGAAPKSMININKRTQALRLHRSGETPDRIAAALGMTRGEVDLLIKVQGLSLQALKVS
jgi:hypothetical protein